MTPLKILAHSALASLALLLATTSSAQLGDDSRIRPYVTLSTGLAFTPDLDSDSFTPFSASLSTERGPNFTIGGGIGALWGYVRHELRADYHRSKASSITPLLAVVQAPTGDVSGDTIGVTTLLYSVGLRQPFFDDKTAVYGTIGIGAALGSIPIGASTMEDWQFGYAFSAGGFYDVWRGIGLDLGYRYVGATTFSENVFSPVKSQFSDGTFPLELDWSTHEVVLSIRYAWGGGD